jgi:hypothetical protein
MRDFFDFRNFTPNLSENSRKSNIFIFKGIKLNARFKCIKLYIEGGVPGFDTLPKIITKFAPGVAVKSSLGEEGEK